MSVEDKLAIHEMIARYSYAYDRKESEAVAQLFVEDGIFEVIVPGKPSPTVRVIVPGSDLRLGEAAIPA